MKFLLSFIFLLNTIGMFAQSPKFDWVTHEGNGSSDYGQKIRRAPNGDLYISIAFSGSTVVAGTTYSQLGNLVQKELLICKYNSFGVFQWAKQLYCSGGNFYPLQLEMEVDGSNNLYVNVGFEGTLNFNSTNYSSPAQNGGYFLAKIDNGGSVLWAKNAVISWGYGGFTSMAVNTNGDIILAGTTIDSITVNNVTHATNYNGNIGKFYVGFSSNGNFSWYKLGEIGDDFYKSIKFDNTGLYFYCLGKYSQPHTFVGGTVSLTNNSGSSDIFLVKIQAYGSVAAQWAISIGSSGIDEAEGLEVDANGNIYVLANISGDCNVGTISVNAPTPQSILAKFNSSGNASFATSMLTSQSFAAYSQGELKIDVAGNLYASGGISSVALSANDTLSPQGQSDAVIFKMNGANGNVVWHKQFGGSAYDVVHAVPYNDNEIYCTGIFAGVVNFGTFQYVVNGPYDPFIAKLSGCDLPTVNVTNSGNTTLCNGQSILLSATNLLGASYQWLSNNSTVPNATNDSITVSVSGVYSVDVNLGGACRDTFGSVNVSVSNINAVVQSANPSICPGGDVQLFTSLPFTNYDWSTGANTPAVTVNQQGTYTVTVADGTGCLDTASITIIEYPEPTTPTVLVGTNCQLASSVIVGGYSYKWRLNGNIVGGNTAYLDAAQNGSGFYSIEITDLNGCKAISSTPTSVDITPCINAIHEATVLTDIKLYPNPNSGTFIVEVKSAGIKQIQIDCLNLLGDLITEIVAQLENGELKTELNLSLISKGVYVIRITADGKSIYKKITITE